MVGVTRHGGRIMFDILSIFHVTSLSVWAYNLFRTSAFIEKIKSSQSLHKYRSPIHVGAILRDLGVDYKVRGYYLFLPVCSPSPGDRADICKYSNLLSYELSDSSLKYFGSKVVYICEKRQDERR